MVANVQLAAAGGDPYSGVTTNFTGLVLGRSGLARQARDSMTMIRRHLHRPRLLAAALLASLAAFGVACGSDVPEEGLPTLVPVATHTPTTDGDASDTASGGDVRVPLREGSSGEIAPAGAAGRLARVTILEIDELVESANPVMSPPPGLRWWGVEVEVENVGSAPVVTLEWTLMDSEGNEVRPAFVLDAGETLSDGYSLVTGETTRGWLYFEVAEDATVDWLRADPNEFLDNDLYFEAE